MCLECDHNDERNQPSWHLTYPLAVVLTEGVIRADGSTEIHATSPHSPELVGTGIGPEAALRQFLWEISNASPLDDATAEDLFAAGYDCDAVNAWQKHVKGSRRHDSLEAITWLRTYEERCVPPAEASHYLAMGLDPKSAATVHAAGRTPEDAYPFVRGFGDFIGFSSCGPVSLDFAADPKELVAWILSDLDFPKAYEYLRAGLGPEQAVLWHPVVTDLDISTKDLADIVCAGFSPEQVTQRHDEHLARGHSVGDAARTMLALVGTSRT